MNRHLRLSTVAAVAAAAVIVAGCGSENKSTSTTTTAAAAPPAAANTTASQAGGSSAGAEVVKLSADPGGALRFTKTHLTARAGKVTLQMANPSQMSHGIGIEGHGVDVDGPTIGPGQTSTATATLKPGTYEYYCTIPSHRAAGMKGTLVVR